MIDDPLEWCQKNHKKISKVMIGVDFGGTNSATPFKAVGITQDWTVIALDEEHIDSRELDPDKLSRRFVEFVRQVQAQYGESQTRADNAESILIRGISGAAKTEGLKTKVLNARKMEINDRIKLTLLLMAQKRLYVSRRCPHLVEAFQTAVYDPKQYKDVRLDDGTSDIDSLDAFEYTLEPWYQHLIRGAVNVYQPTMLR